MPIFPTEIFDRILYLAFGLDEPLTPATPPTAPRLAPVVQLLRVSKAFHALALPFLYHTVVIAKQEDWLVYFAARTGHLATKGGGHGSLVRALAIDWQANFPIIAGDRETLSGPHGSHPLDLCWLDFGQLPDLRTLVHLYPVQGTRDPWELRDNGAAYEEAQEYDFSDYGGSDGSDGGDYTGPEDSMAETLLEKVELRRDAVRLNFFESIASHSVKLERLEAAWFNGSELKIWTKREDSYSFSFSVIAPSWTTPSIAPLLSSPHRPLVVLSRRNKPFPALVSKLLSLFPQAHVRLVGFPEKQVFARALEGHSWVCLPADSTE